MSNLDVIKRMLQVSPGSTILLRGHVDNAMVEDFRKKGGEDFVRRQALKAMELSKQRAASVRQMLISKLTVDAQRIEVVGRGWEEPISAEPDENRRVEVQWFTIE
jgi:NitT/TauT family transport system substrate-binding protein